MQRSESGGGSLANEKDLNCRNPNDVQRICWITLRHIFFCLGGSFGSLGLERGRFPNVNRACAGTGFRPGDSSECGGGDYGDGGVRKNCAGELSLPCFTFILIILF